MNHKFEIFLPLFLLPLFLLGCGNNHPELIEITVRDDLVSDRGQLSDYFASSLSPSFPLNTFNPLVEVELELGQTDISWNHNFIEFTLTNPTTREIRIIDISIQYQQHNRWYDIYNIYEELVQSQIRLRHQSAVDLTKDLTHLPYGLSTEGIYRLLLQIVPTTCLLYDGCHHHVYVEFNVD